MRVERDLFLIAMCACVSCRVCVSVGVIEVVSSKTGFRNAEQNARHRRLLPELLVVVIYVALRIFFCLSVSPADKIPISINIWCVGIV